MKLIIDGIEFDVDFDYTPGEPMVMYYADGSGYPGSDPEIEINSITHKGTDFTDFLIGRMPYEELEGKIFDQMQDAEAY